MARFLKPLVRSGGYYPSRRWTPLVYPGGYTTANGGEEPAPPPVEKTVIGNPIHILDALAKPAQALSVKLEPIQAGSGDPSPDNVRPISGWTECKVTRTGINVWDEETESGRISAEGKPYVDASFIRTKNFISIKPNTAYYRKSPNNIQLFWYDAEQNFLSYANWGTGAITSPSNAYYVKFHIDPAYGTTYNHDISINYPSTDTDYHSGADGATYSIAFPTSAGTVYGGTLDVTTGKLTVDRAMVTVTGEPVGNVYGSPWPYVTIVPTLFPNIKSGVLTDVTAAGECLSDQLALYRFTSTSGHPNTFYFSNRSLYVREPTFIDTTSKETAQASLNANPVSVVYPLATPITIQLTPTQVELLQGENNIWSDGEMTLVYLADGNASDVEALNILLGGRYVNNHTEGEPTDREALDIVLGGKK